MFGTGSYDALNRLKSADFSSWSGSAWTSTLAYDLAGITYDAGNLTALQRYRENATLIDNLTYSYPGSSNRLSAVADAISTTSETWDAESGSFTYDANGNMKTAPAPYSITALTYDHQNLPLSLTRSGVTTTYRYNETGQRITKRVGSGNTEVYVLAGLVTLAVLHLDGSGALVRRDVNIVAGDRVIGGQINGGNWHYYYDADLLGSTRSVVEGSTPVEAYDFDPWGLRMPVRTLAGPTKEGFTGKELDAETGLGYFGARYYMAALGRWGSVDPLAEKHLEWSPYNYVLNNPLTLIDPDGRQVMANSNAFWEGVAVDGFQQGGVRGRLKVLAGITAMTAFEFFGMNQAEAGFGAMAEGNWVSGTASVGMAVAGNLPGLNFSKFGRASGGLDDAARAVGRIGDDAASGAAHLADDALVCRGGTCTADRFAGGSGVTIDASGRMSGVSVNSAPGASLEELTATIPNRQVGVTTVGDVRAAGGNVVPAGSGANPLHAQMSGLTPEQAERLFTPTVRNPNIR